MIDGGRPDCGCARVDRLAVVVRPRLPRPIESDDVAVLLESSLLCPGPARRTEPSRWEWGVLGRAQVVGARLVAGVALGAVGWRYGWSAALPVLLAVPLGELLVAWHGGQARYGFASYDERGLLVRHLRAIGRRALLALVPPLLVASALLAVAGHLPAGRPLAEATAARAALGVLLAGWYGLLLLLAARRRLLSGLAVVGAGVALSPFCGLWPLAGGYLLGLVLAALTLFDPRRFTAS